MDHPLPSSVRSESAESGKPRDLAESLSTAEQLKINSRACGWDNRGVKAEAFLLGLAAGVRRR